MSDFTIPVIDVTPYRDKGIDSDSAMRWYDAGFSATEAAVLHAVGFRPGNAAGLRALLNHNASEIASWNALRERDDQ